MGIEGMVVFSTILGNSDMFFTLFAHSEVTCYWMRDAWGVPSTNCTRRSGDDPALIFKTPMNPARKSPERLGTRLDVL